MLKITVFRLGASRLFYPAGLPLRLIFLRGPGRDFCDRDRDLLTVLRPHLHQAYLDAERRRHPAPSLTARHWDLLHLVAAGHTNAQIARRLRTSEATVRTHLEHIYRLLQVSSQTAAVTRIFTDPNGLTPPDPRPGPPHARPRVHGTGLSPLPAAPACHYTPAHDLPPVARLGHQPER